jgi:hypothetical protein
MKDIRRPVVLLATWDVHWGIFFRRTASCIELPGHIVLVSIIHRTISLWLSSTEVDDDEGPGDQLRSGLSPQELRRELVEDTEDMLDYGAASTILFGGYGGTAGERVYIGINLVLGTPIGAWSSQNDQIQIWVQEIESSFRSRY